MTDFFRIETDKSSLTWSGRVPPEVDSASLSSLGRLAISPRTSLTTHNIKAFRLGIAKELWDDPAVNVGPRLYEETSYSLFLTSLDGKHVEIRHRDPLILRGLSNSNGHRVVHGTINFKSQVGRSRFTVLVDYKPEYDFEIEVFPSKLDYESDYNALVADVQDILAGLVLEYLQSTFKLGLTTHAQKPTKLEWITLLRHLIQDLERALHYIAEHPHHGLSRKRLLTRVERLRRPDATIRKMVSQGKGFGVKLKLASGLVIHSKLPEQRARVTLNTPEHRWLASQLTHVKRQLAQLHKEERNRITKHQELTPRQWQTLQEIESLENRIAILQKLEMIAQAEGSVPAGFTSLKLQLSPGYREAYRACLLLLLGLRVAGGPVGLSVKQIHQLYEYWCYLALLRLLAEITGEKIPASRLLSVQQTGLRVQLQKGRSQTVVFAKKANRSAELTYSPHYTGDAFIFSQKPDVVLTLRDQAWPTMRLVLDAKYRVNSDVDYISQLGSAGPPENAINVLHRYRDAILEQSAGEGPRSDTLKRTVIEGVALFPHQDVEDRFRNSRLWKALERVGVGALPFLPSETRYVEEWLRTVLQRGGWATAERSIPYVSQEHLGVWQRAAKEAVLIGVLRPNASEHLDWIKREHCYYTFLNNNQPRQLIARWIAIYSPTSLRPRGAITHVAGIRNISVRQRDTIQTPWSATRGSELRCVVYELDELRELDRAIENCGPDGLGQRFSKNRWTSRLGLLRATELRELFLETEPEWRLYEQLRVTDLDFSLHPDPPKVQDEDVRGRTWFVIQNVKVQYRGSAGFLIRTTAFPDEYVAHIARVVERVRSASL